ncbi:MAG: hypothetical protein CVU44_15450 [Chloroflexi bacterium HGW-Chloroflexi-6]|nr:MAG: hypothetical protein CVU44_15450 [Chloroflexi bacterium HGW-Chloroflexi-6]
MKKTTTIFILFVILTGFLFPAAGNPVSAAPAQAGTPGLPILFGAYPSLDLQSSIGELAGMNTWLVNNGASGVTFAGDFMTLTFNPTWNVPHELNAAWDNGFVPFVNLMPSESWEGSYYVPNCATASTIAAGSCDTQLAAWANHFKTWAGSSKFAYIAPLPEMNGEWVAYGSDGATFIQAFLRIRQVFENQGVPDSAIRWVFAPNGWHDVNHPWKSFEYYYPGDGYVDVIAFSSYNFGGCPENTPWRSWDTFDTTMKLYLDRMRVMAPGKPIFIAQTATVNVPDDPADPNQTKSFWIEDTFDKLADYPAVRAIIYFNKLKAESGTIANCPGGADYRVYYGGSSGETGFLNMMKDARFGKWATNSSNWQNIAFADVSYTFADVQPSHPFSGAPNVWYYDYVHSLYNAGITGGCAVNPELKYCPSNPVTRAQMAIFLERGMNGSAFSPPPATGTRFSDVPASYWAASWVEQLAEDGITSGCGSGNYCPDYSVTRAQMAIFLLKAEHGKSYSPPAASGTMFGDVPANHWAAAWIEQLAVEGITGGCGSGNYCPESPVTRAQMAVFLVRTFNLP